MKKGLLLVVVMLATIAVKAQDIYVGGSLNVWRNSTGNTTSFKVAPASVPGWNCCYWFREN